MHTWRKVQGLRSTGLIKRQHEEVLHKYVFGCRKEILWETAHFMSQDEDWITLCDWNYKTPTSCVPGIFHLLSPLIFLLLSKVLSFLLHVQEIQVQRNSRTWQIIDLGLDNRPWSWPLWALDSDPGVLHSTTYVPFSILLYIIVLNLHCLYSHREPL